MRLLKAVIATLLITTGAPAHPQSPPPAAQPPSTGPGSSALNPVAVLGAETKNARDILCGDATRPKISLLGDGYAQLVQLRETAQSVGMGIAFEAARREGFVFIKKGSISSVDNDRRAFGQSMLTPESTNVAASAILRVYPFCRVMGIWGGDTTIGLSAFAQGGSVDWKIPDPSDPATSLTKNAFVYALGIGVPFRIWPAWLTANAIKLTVTPSLTMRGVSGDVAADSAFVTTALGDTSRKTAWGGQVELELRINEVFATATATKLTGNLPGLSGGQFFVALGFRGGIDLGREITSAAATRPAAASSNSPPASEGTPKSDKPKT